jgi:pimeloyl-ACP methyl ester carboxylesterase
MGSPVAMTPPDGRAETPQVVPVRLPDGVRLHTIAHCRAETTPLTVVFVHGWTLDHRMWRCQLADLPHRLGVPVQLVAFDLRGHGLSSPTNRAGATIEQLGDDLAVVVRELASGGRVVLVGHSLGGMAIMEYAHRHPADFAQRVAGVVLVSTSAEGSSRTSYGLSPWLAFIIRVLETRSADVLARSGSWRPHRRLMPLISPGVRWLVFGNSADAAWVSLTTSMVGTASLCAIGGFRPSVSLHDRVAALVAMRDLPAAVLVGSRDRLTPQACAETIADALPLAERFVCTGAGHMLPLERPDDVTDAIARVCLAALRTEPPRTRPPRQRRWRAKSHTTARGLGEAA